MESPSLTLAAQRKLKTTTANKCTRRRKESSRQSSITQATEASAREEMAEIVEPVETAMVPAVAVIDSSREAAAVETEAVVATKSTFTALLLGGRGKGRRTRRGKVFFCIIF
jgi:predicted AAA+ superfamily ATPase